MSITDGRQRKTPLTGRNKVIHMLKDEILHIIDNYRHHFLLEFYLLRK